MISPTDALNRLEGANPVPSLEHIDDDAVAAVWAIIEAGFDEQQPVSAAATPPTVWWRRPVVAVAAAFAFVIAVIGVVALLRNTETPVAETTTTTTTLGPETTTTAVPTTTTTPESTTAAPTTTTVATLPPKPASLEITWQRIPTSPALEDGWIAAVTEGGPGFVAVGGTIGCREPLERQCPLDPALWLSPDGVTWERVDSPSFSGEAARTLPSGATFDGDQYFSDVVAGPVGIVAVGYDQLINTEGPAGDTDRSGVWWSADGRTWENVSRAETGDGGVFSDAGVWRVALLGDRYLAIGELTAWISEDGRSWQRHEIGTEPETRVAELIVWQGRAVAVGASSGRPAAWFSEDGMTWERIADPDFDTTSGSFMGVAEAPDGLIALQVVWPRLILWRSSDGTDWAPLEISIESDVWEFAPRSGQFIPAGTTPTTDDITLITDPYTMWGTADGGDTWYQVGQFDGGMLEALGSESPHFFSALNDVIVDGDRLLAVGKFVEFSSDDSEYGACYIDSGGSCRADAAVWIGTWE